jgi:hypothetical protein
MSETAILAAARAAVSAALPLAKDWTDDPANVKPDKLDAFVVEVRRDGATFAAMGSTLEEVQLTIQVEVFTKYAPNQDGRALVGVKGEAARAALMSAGPLAALLDVILGATFDVDVAAGETRLARATVGLSVQSTF